MRLSTVQFRRFVWPLKLVGSAFLAFSLICGTLLAGSIPAFAEDTAGIAGAPSDGGKVDQTRSRFSYQVEPGQVINDEYLVSNSGSTAADLTVYATDAYNLENGDYGLLDSNLAPKDVGTWVTFDGGVQRLTLNLAPGESRAIPFTVSVPADASPGDHAGGMIISSLTDSGQVKLDRRIATRLYLRVKGDVTALMTVSSISASYAPSLNPFSGTVNITYTLTNNGNVSLGANSAAMVKGIFGIPLSGVTRNDIPELLPGTSRSMTVSVEGVGQWIYLNPSVSIAATVDDDAINPGPLPAADRDVPLFVPPFALLIIAALAGGIYFFVKWKRNRDYERAQAWLEFVKEEEKRRAEQESIGANQ
jgi:dihydroorotate dehydrogenase (fumarate)